MADAHLGMSDEEFLNQLPPETVEVVVDTPPQEKTPETPPAIVDDEPLAEGEIPPVIEDEPAPAEKTPEEKQDEKAPVEANPDATGSTPAGEKPAEGDAGKPPVEEVKPQTEAPNFENLYTEIMKPFTANGKEIKLDKPEEVRQLMQMGANYTRKMQELAPHRKLITMLKNNSVDEDKLSFLIDLDKKDPEAIKRLIKDSGLDPLDIDTNTEPAYREGSHKVSDEEQTFVAVLEEVDSTPEGKETLEHIDKTWDQTSKDMLWQNPEVMTVIRDQRKAGIYATIVAEVDRQKLLGQLKPDVPFLQAYKIAGDSLYAAQIATPTPVVEAKPEPTPVVTRTAAPKSDVEASDKAAAASAPRAKPTTAQEAVNFLSMSDDAFLKIKPFEGRV